jgi:cobalt-zinc-cadmium efflux system outer membrane protein
MHVMQAARCCAAALVATGVVSAVATAQVAPVPIAQISMEDAVRLAIQHNQALQAQRLDLDAAKADELTAGLKPNPNVSFGVDGFTPFSPRQINGDFLRNTASYSSALSYTFERGGKRNRRVAVAEAATDVTAKNVQDAERQLRFQTTQAFIDVLLAKAASDVAAENLASFSEVVDINRQRVASGALAEGDFYRISLQKLQFEQDVSAAEVALVQSNAALRQLLGYDTVAEHFAVTGTLAFTTPAPMSLDDLERQALASRPDLLSAQSAVQLAQNAAALEHANRARDVGGDVDYTHTGPDNTFGVGVAIDLPIHDRNQGNIARSEVAVRQAEQTAAAARVAVITDVVSAYAAFQTSAKVVGLYQSGYLSQAQQSLDISRYVYQQGAGTLLDLLDAERTYRDTQIGYLQALAAYMTSVQQMNFAIGRQVIP